jgi:hypothetical protein
MNVRKREWDLPWLKSSNHIAQSLQVAEDLKRRGKMLSSMLKTAKTGTGGSHLQS